MNDPLPPPVRRVAVLLAQGLDDRGVSRRERVTVRTVRRRVARLMGVLGARTRFQAGYLVCREGVLEMTVPVDDNRQGGQSTTVNTLSDGPIG